MSPLISDAYHYIPSPKFMEFVENKSMSDGMNQDGDL